MISVNLVTTILHVDMRAEGVRMIVAPFTNEPKSRMILFTFWLTHFSWR